MVVEGPKIANHASEQEILFSATVDTINEESRQDRDGKSKPAA